MNLSAVVVVTELLGENAVAMLFLLRNES